MVDNPTTGGLSLHTLGSSVTNLEGWWVGEAGSDEGTFVAGCQSSINGDDGGGSADGCHWGNSTAHSFDLWATGEGELVSLVDAIRKDLLGVKVVGTTRPTSECLEIESVCTPPTQVSTSCC